AGWTEITNPTSPNAPDVPVQPAVTTSTSTGIAYWPPYWGWYPGYPAYCCYGWGGWATAYSYTTGTLLMAMLDLKHADTVGMKVPVMWLGAVHRGLRRNAPNPSRLLKGIEPAIQTLPFPRQVMPIR